MGGIEVRSPDGLLWNVTRRRSHRPSRRFRYRKRMERATRSDLGAPQLTTAQLGQAMGGTYPTTPDGPALLGMLDLPIDAAIAVATFFRCVVARKPWRIDVVSRRGRLLVAHRCGWDDSLRLCRDIASQLRHGTELAELVLPPERGTWQPVHLEPLELARQQRGPIR